MSSKPSQKGQSGKGQPAKDGKAAPAQRNEGEGNRTAAREFNEAETAFVKSGAVDEAAKKARAAVEGPENRDLLDAEQKGREKARH